MRIKWYIAFCFLLMGILAVNWCHCDAAINLPYFATEAGSSSSLNSLEVNTIYYMGLEIDCELYQGSTIYVESAQRYVDSEGKISYGESTKYVIKAISHGNAYKNNR